MSKKRNKKQRGHGAQTAPKASPPPETRASSPSEAAPTDQLALHLLRVTIEAKSPLALGSGDIVAIKREERADGKKKSVTTPETALARDAHGLPTIPGATIQGLLRVLADDGSDMFRRFFGYAHGDDGKAASLFVGFG